MWLFGFGLQKCVFEEIIGVMQGEKNTYGFSKSRERMVGRDLKGRDITDPGVLSVMGRLNLCFVLSACVIK